MKVEEGTRAGSYINHYKQSDISFAKGIPNYSKISNILKKELDKRLWEEVVIKEWKYNEPSDRDGGYCNVPSFQFKIDDNNIIILYPVVWKYFEEDAPFLIPEKGEKLTKAVWLCELMLDGELVKKGLEDSYEKEIEYFVNLVENNSD